MAILRIQRSFFTGMGRNLSLGLAAALGAQGGTTWPRGRKKTSIIVQEILLDNAERSFYD
jgi:hypothetical protein